MQNDREARQTLGDFFQNVKAELRFLAGFEFVSAVAGADCNCERVNVRFLNEFLNLSRIGVRSVFRRNVDGILDTGKTSEFAFNGDSAGDVHIPQP